MAHCVICNKDFANSASLRTHRSKFHRMSNNSPKDIESQDTLDEEINDSEDESEEDDKLSKLRHNRHNKDTLDEDSQDTIDEESKKDTMSGKRKHSETEDTDNEEDYPYLPKKKDQHMYKKLSNIHDILKNHLEDSKTIFGVLDCYSIKQVIDSLVPGKFDTDLTMKEALTYEQFLYVTNTRKLQTLADIHLAINDKEARGVLFDIIEIIERK